MRRVLPLLLVFLALVVLSGMTVQAAALADAHEGVVVKAGAGKLTMTDKDGKNEHSHDVAADAKISRDGKDCRLEDLKKGDKVKVTTEKKGGKEAATRIEAQSK